MDQLDSFLLTADPWVEYRTLIDLHGRPEDDDAVQDARRRMLAHPLVTGLLEELQGWPGHVLNSHKSASQLYHKLAFVAELGIARTDPGMADIISLVLAHRSAEGLIRLSTNVPVHFGGTGCDEWAWALCDAPTSQYALARLGLADDPDFRAGTDYLAGLVRNNGWPCVVCKELGNFRGPGKKSDPCPYATLIMLKLLAQYDQYKDSPAAHSGVECLLTLWATSREQHPFQFYMGTDFCKLKAPFIWYDILHVAEVLSQFPFARTDDCLIDMLGQINAKADENGFFTPESVWQAWQGWDFAQKKQPSAWLTFLVHRLNRRFG